MFQPSRDFPNPAAGSVGDEARFTALWNRAVAGAPMLARTIFTRLTQLYGEPHRHYHTLGHIRRCLEEFDQVIALLDDPGAVEMALWFHDAIYAPGAQDNEWRSAELFRQWSEGYTDSVFCRRVYDLIMITTHRQWPPQRDEQYIVDIDLASFGLSWDEFERDGQLIRAECGEMADAEYYPGHLRFLLSLQNRPTFFFTNYFQQRYEYVARANIQRVVENLRARGFGDA